MGWGVFWSRPGLTRKQRSLLNLGILAALNRHHELAVHVKGAVNNGLTKEEIREALIHVIPYAGFPAGLDAFRTAWTRWRARRAGERGSWGPSPNFACLSGMHGRRSEPTGYV